MKKFNQKIIILIVAVFTISFNANSQDEHICQYLADQYSATHDELVYTMNLLTERNQLINSLQMQLDSAIANNAVAVYTATPLSLDLPLNLPEGWSMFGYACVDSIDAMVGFSEISDKIEIVKDEWGLSYIPSWEFNAMGN